MADTAAHAGLPTLRKRAVDAIPALAGHLLFAGFFVSAAAVVLTNNGLLPQRLLHQWVMPVFAVVLLISPWRDQNGARHPLVALSRSVILWASLAYVAMLLLSTILQPDAAGGVLRDPLKRAGDIVLFLSIVAYLVATYPRFLQRFMTGFAALLAVHAAINVAAFLHDPAMAEYRLRGSFGTPLYVNATHLAPLYAIWSVAAVSLLANGALHRLEAAIVALSATILLPCVLLTQARGGMLAVAIGLLVIALLAKPRWRWTILGVIAVAFLLAVSIEPLRLALFGRGDSFRVALATQYLQIAMDRPWTGFGLVRPITLTMNNVVYEQPHNTLIWAQLRGGIPAALAAVVLLGGALLWSLRYWTRHRIAAPLIAVLLLAITSLTEIGFLVITYNWLWVVFWLPVGIAAGTELAMKLPLTLPRVGDVDRPYY